MKKLPNHDCHTCESRVGSVFCELSDSGLVDLKEGKQTSLYKKGQVVFVEGNKPNSLYCVLSGKLKLSKTGDEGKEQILHLAHEGDVIGYRALLSGETYSCTAETLEETRICQIPKELFFNLVDGEKSVSTKMLQLLSKELGNTEKNVVDLVQKPVFERVALVLLHLMELFGFEKDGKTLLVKMNRNELGSMAGTSAESFIRVLHTMKDEGIIETVGKIIKILDENKLIKAANII